MDIFCFTSSLLSRAAHMRSRRLSPALARRVSLQLDFWKSLDRSAARFFGCNHGALDSQTEGIGSYVKLIDKFVERFSSHLYFTLSVVRRWHRIALVIDRAALCVRACTVASVLPSFLFFFTSTRSDWPAFLQNSQDCAQKRVDAQCRSGITVGSGFLAVTTSED